MDKKIKNIFIIFSLIFIFFILAFFKIFIEGLINGLNICLNILIPNMFIFLVISEFFYRTNILFYILKPFSFIFEKLFKIDRKLGPIIFLSLIFGYPVGASLISQAVNKKEISKKTAQRMLYFSVNSGIFFLIGVVSIPITNNIKLGIIIFISQLISFFVVGYFSSFGNNIEKLKKINNKRYSISKTFVESVTVSIKNMAIICLYTLFFSAIAGLFLKLNILNIKYNIFLKPIILGFFDVINGINACTNIKNIYIFLIIVIITSFGGLSLYFQLKFIAAGAKIKLKNFFFWRLIYTLTTLVSYTYIFRNFAVFAFAAAKKYVTAKIEIHPPVISICLIVLSVALLSCDKKNIIINKKIKM